MARFDVPKRTSAAIYVRSVSQGKETFIRKPYNVVSIDYGDGTAIQTYIELTCGHPRSDSERTEIYDEVRIYDSEPFPSVRIGYGAAGQ